jgi:L-lactate dehydrogenase (cytochrome)
VDGGVRRATDVLKAVALGATAVGIGRPMIYSMSTYGEEGVSKALQILKVGQIEDSYRRICVWFSPQYLPLLAEEGPGGILNYC